MRTWLLAALLVLVSLQSAWAAAGRACLHETHTCAHPCQHAHRPMAPDTTATVDAQPPCFPDDAECEACHGGCAAVLAHAPLPAGHQATRRPSWPTTLPPASVPPGTPERPQWP